MNQAVLKASNNGVFALRPLYVVETPLGSYEVRPAVVFIFTPSDHLNLDFATGTVDQMRLLLKGQNVVEMGQSLPVPFSNGEVDPYYYTEELEPGEVVGGQDQAAKFFGVSL